MPNLFDAIQMTPDEIRRLKIKAEAARWIIAKENARNGDPVPYIRLQWPGVILDEWQERELQEFFRPEVRELYIKGNTGSGKGAFIALVVCLFYDLWEDARVVLTRDSKDTAKKILFAEVAKWFRAMAMKPEGKLTAEKIQHPVYEQHVIAVSNPATGEGFSGVHTPHVLFVFDEATAPILEKRFELADTQATKFLATANPRTIAGCFRKAFPSGSPNVTQTIVGPFGLRRLVTIGGKDCKNVREKRLKIPVSPPGGIQIIGRWFPAGETIPADYFEQVRPIIPGQTCYDQFVGLCQHPDPNFVNCYAHGMFPDEDPEKQLISLSWLEAPNQFWKRFDRVWQHFRRRNKARSILNSYFRVEALGLDVAASTDGDESILTVGGSLGIRGQWAKRFRDTTELVDWVSEIVSEQFGIDLEKSGLPIAVDMDGVGKGVGDMLRRRGCRVVEIHGGSTSEVNTDLYANKRAESYGELAARLDPSGAWKGQTFALPEDYRLAEELIAHQKIFVSKDAMRFRVTPKEPVPGVKDVLSVKQQIGRSPDRSDSAVYFYRALVAAGGFDISAWLKAGAI